MRNEENLKEMRIDEKFVIEILNQDFGSQKRGI